MSLRTHKVGDGPETPVLVLLQETHQERADGVRLPWRQLQWLVEDSVVHHPHVPAVERRLKESGGYKKSQPTSSRKMTSCLYQEQLLSAEQAAIFILSDLPVIINRSNMRRMIVKCLVL